MIPSQPTNPPSDRGGNSGIKVKFEPPFPEWLFSTCRAILDSKYTDFVFTEDMGFASSSRLTDFIYSWLGRFTVDITSRSIRQVDFDERERVDKTRLQFAIGMQSVKGQKMFEYSLFTDFMSEKYANDELYFYLHCRHILFKGPQLNHTQSTHERVYKIDIRRVQSAINILFFKLHSSERNKILGKIVSLATEASKVL